jgi:hypothetical protein
MRSSRTLMVLGVSAAVFVLGVETSPPAQTPSRAAYEPIAEAIEPDAWIDTRAVEVKGGYLYLLERTSDLHVFDISSLPHVTGFTTYDTPLSTLDVTSRAGLVRRNSILYGFGESGIEVFDISVASSPQYITLVSGAWLYNLVEHGGLLIGCANNEVVVYGVAASPVPTEIGSHALGSGNRGWSAAVNGDVLYVGQANFSAPAGNGLLILDFQDPTNPFEIDLLPMDVVDVPYHLAIVDGELVATGDFGIRLFDLSTPTAPALVDEESTGGRVCAVDGPYVITNGHVFRVQGGALQLVDSFDPVYMQNDGFPYGSAVHSGFVFLAQSERILILDVRLFADGFESGDTMRWSASVPLK